MTGLSAYALLAASAFLSATLLPGSSEAVLLGLLANGRGEDWLLVAVASAANVAGSVVNWAIGRFGAGLAGDAAPAIRARLDRARGRFARFGSWVLLLAWVPVIGDPLTLVAGLLRVPFWRFLALVSVGKVARYAALALAWEGSGLV